MNHKEIYVKVRRKGKLTISIHTLVVRVSSFSFCDTREDTVSVFKLGVVDVVLMLI